MYDQSFYCSKDIKGSYDSYAHIVPTIFGNAFELKRIVDGGAFLKWQKSNQSHQLTLVWNGKNKTNFDYIFLSCFLC